MSDHLRQFHNNFIQNSKPKEIVSEEILLLCYLTFSTKKNVGFSSHPVYITTKALKHLYDKKPAQEYDSILCNLDKIVRYPDYVYKNPDEKRGNFCIIKAIEDQKYFCSLEDRAEGGIYVVTAFCLRKENYIKKYELLWSWRDGKSSS